MALITCPDCGKEVSDTAKTCIGCGRPMERKAVKEERKTSILVWVVTIAIVGGLVFYFGLRPYIAAKTVERLADQYRIEQLLK